MITSRRFFLLGAGASIAAAAAAKLIIPGIVEPPKFAHMALPDDPLVDYREILELSFGATGEPGTGPVTIRVGYPGGASPLFQLGMASWEIMRWRAGPESGLILNRDRPLLFIDMQGGDGVGMAADVTFTDRYHPGLGQWPGDVWIQRFSFPSGEASKPERLSLL